MEKDIEQHHQNMAAVAEGRASQAKGPDISDYAGETETLEMVRDSMSGCFRMS